jgi:hypothetical protein
MDKRTLVGPVLVEKPSSGKRAETATLPWTDEYNDASIYKEAKAFHSLYILPSKREQW